MGAGVLFRGLLGLGLIVSLSAFESQGGPPPEREAGPNLPFVIDLPEGFTMTVRSGVDTGLFTIRKGEEPYLTIWSGMASADEVKADGKGHFSPPVQQEVDCAEGDSSPERRILRLERENVGTKKNPHPPLYLVIEVRQRLDLPPDKQVVADRIAASVFVPGKSLPIRPTALLTCASQPS